MKKVNDQYIVELKSGPLVTAAALGFGLFGSVVGGAKALGVGRFAQQQQQAAPLTTAQPVQRPAQQQPSQQAPQKAAPSRELRMVQQPQAANPHGPFKSEHSRRLYGALVSAEHRGVVKDPYSYDPNVSIRTKAKPKSSSGPHSTAFGPTQITYSTAKGYADPKNPYHTRFLEQGRQFLKHSRTGHADFGYGGKGTLGAEEHHEDFQKFSEHVMERKAKELKLDIHRPMTREQLARFTQHWRHGSGSGKKPEKWYSSAVNNFYLENPNQNQRLVLP